MIESKPSLAEFFAVAQPGLEDLVEAEIREWRPDLKLQTEHGGVTFFAPLSEGVALNLCLKTATRILVRVARFRCRDFPKLFKIVSRFPWDQWIHPDCHLQVQASTRVSRLKIKARIEDTCLDAWAEFQEEKGVKTNRKKLIDLYVRFADDVCTLSLDTSGERLHKRGERTLIGEAPLRESIAAALIQNMGRQHGGGEGGVEVIDPMMGSGTFLIEAALRDQVMDRRDFAFENFVGLADSRVELKVARPQIKKVIGFELDRKTIQAAKANLSNSSVGLEVDLKNQDIFQAASLPKTDKPRWVFVNPPYGERLSVKEPLAEYYAKLFAACEKAVHPDKACFILPSKVVKGKFQLPPAWKVIEKRPFLNGGIPVVAFVFSRINGRPE